MYTYIYNLDLKRCEPGCGHQHSEARSVGGVAHGTREDQNQTSGRLRRGWGASGGRGEAVVGGGGASAGALRPRGRWPLLLEKG